MGIDPKSLPNGHPIRAAYDRALHGEAPAATKRLWPRWVVVGRQSCHFRSGTELARAGHLQLVARRWWHQAITFVLPGGVRYTADFLWEPGSGDFMLPDSRRIVEEVKFDWATKNARDSRTRLRIAAALFPEFEFRAVSRPPADPGSRRRVGWLEEVIHPMPQEAIS
jgi:hypothetical protein